MPCGGGGGSSSSSTSNATTTNNTDKRLVVDGGSYGVSADNSSVSIQTSDMGAIQGAGQIALASLNTNSNNFDHLLSTADHLLTQQQKGIESASSLTKSLAGTAQQAYSDAANQASGNKQLILAAMAVVAVVAFTSLNK